MGEKWGMLGYNPARRQQADPNGYLLRFEDGPMASRHNVENPAGASGNTVIPATMFDWPLPDRLAILAYPGVDNVAFWNADGNGDGLPAQIHESPNAVVYRKVSESTLPSGVKRVVRGALYRVESP